MAVTGMDGFYSSFEIDETQWTAAVLRMRRSIQNKILFVLTEVGKEVVQYLRGYTGETRPDDPRAVWSRGRRAAHPGGWADITKDLRKGYAYEVRADHNGDVYLTIINNSRDAAFVEAMDGFFVVRGVVEPGGPVDLALRATLETIDRKGIYRYSGAGELGNTFVAAPHGP